MQHFLSYSKSLVVRLLILLVCIAVIFNSYIIWAQTKQVAKFRALEQQFIKQKQYWQELNVKINEEWVSKQRFEQLSGQLEKLSNAMDQAGNTDTAYQVKATLRLTSLAAMHLMLAKEPQVAKGLLLQAISKLVKFGDPRLNPTLYQLQDEYDKLATNEELKGASLVWQKLDQINDLLHEITLNKNEELADIFSNDNNEESTRFFDLVSISKESEKPQAKISDNYALQLMALYLEQLRLAYLQNSDFFYQATIKNMKQLLPRLALPRDSLAAIDNNISWLQQLKLEDNSGLMQAIINLEHHLSNYS